MNLKEIREKYGLNQKELAQLFELNQSSVSRLESGQHDLRVKDLAKLMRALKLSFEEVNDLIMETIKDDYEKV